MQIEKWLHAATDIYM